MYSVGIAIYDMWIGRRAYWDELDAFLTMCGLVVTLTF